MKVLLTAAGLLLASTTTVVAQQPIAAEVSATAGTSTDRVSAGAVQGRIFGDLKSMRVFGEATWANLNGPTSEAFGAAYPYKRRVQVMDAYAERLFHRGPMLAGVRGGRFRTPFGIYSSSDYAYGGFLRAPLIRYTGYWALSNTFLEHGVNVVGGVAALQGEYTIAAPADAGEVDQRRRGGTDQIVRVQGYHGALVVGASHIRTQPYEPAEFAFGRTVFSGVDGRWMRGGFQMRGEWISGRPFNGVHTRGGYVDTFLHRREMGPFTAVGRVEILDYDAGIHSALARRTTIGTRVHLIDSLYAQLNASHQSGALYSARPTSTDVAITYTLRYPR